MKFKTLRDLVELIDENQNQLGIDYISKYSVMVINEVDSFDGGRRVIDVNNEQKMIYITIVEKA